mmetsp:Transcript_11098/g.41117  ORF Transcript_11098/g.41117 Transcript_11098/m.41117 type:complete len:225 (-) Transcript_11098:1142-1816(-)
MKSRDENITLKFDSHLIFFGTRPPGFHALLLDGPAAPSAIITRGPSFSRPGRLSAPFPPTRAMNESSPSVPSSLEMFMRLASCNRSSTDPNALRMCRTSYATPPAAMGPTYPLGPFLKCVCFPAPSAGSGARRSSCSNSASKRSSSSRRCASRVWCNLRSTALSSFRNVVTSEVNPSRSITRLCSRSLCDFLTFLFSLSSSFIRSSYCVAIALRRCIWSLNWLT